MYALSAERRSLSRLQLQKGIPGEAELPGDRLARQQSQFQPQRELLGPHEQLAEEKGHFDGPQADHGKQRAMDP